MKSFSDYHIHTTFSDGNNTPEELVQAAIERGMAEIGFSDHSYTFFDESYCLQRDKIAEYKRETARLKEKYKSQIKILCGIEQDYYSAESAEDYDYAIGSVHYLKKDGKYYSIDDSRDCFLNLAKDLFDGDYYAFAEEYFKTVSGFADRKEIKIIGHFDLVSKYNGDGGLFDERNRRYVSAWQKAADKLVAAGKVFEINTGAIARGYRSEPYPSDAIKAYIKDTGGRFILSSDSHSVKTLCFGFDKIKL